MCPQAFHYRRHEHIGAAFARGRTHAAIRASDFGASQEAERRREQQAFLPPTMHDSTTASHYMPYGLLARSA